MFRVRLGCVLVSRRESLVFFVESPERAPEREIREYLNG